MLRAPFVLIWNLLKLIGFVLKWPLVALGNFLTRKQRKWVRLKLPSRLQFGPLGGLAAHFQDKLSYLEIRAGVDMIIEDDRIEGVVVTADRLIHGPARTGDLRRMLQRLRDAGKKVIFHTHNIHGADYDLATGADEVLMSPGGRFYLFGERFEQYFASEMLDKLGVAAQFVHIGPYKTASHRFTRRQSTSAQRLMMNQVVDSMATVRERRIADRRGLSPGEIEHCFDRMPLDDRQAVAFGLVDGRIHRRFLVRWIDEGGDFIDTPPPPDANQPRATPEPPALSTPGEHPEEPPAQPKGEPEDEEASKIVNIRNIDSYIDGSFSYRWTPLFRRRRTVAVLDLSGMIVMPGMELPGPSLATIDPSEVLPVLRKIAADRRIGAVVLHVNSPGGHAFASELIWDGIRRLRYAKPVLAYCSDVAASGGYYIACGADRIICHPDTITGSIGVIAGKFSLPGTLDKIGINSESFQRHDTSLFETLAEPLSEKVLENLQRDARSFYRQFLRRVGDARQLPRRRLHRYARGRIYTGVDAHSRFLVDHLGGFDDALAIARSLAEPQLDDTTPVKFYQHRKVSLPALLRQSASAPSAASLLPDHLTDLKLLHDMADHHPLLALMPWRLEN